MKIKYQNLVAIALLTQSSSYALQSEAVPIDKNLILEHSEINNSQMSEQMSELFLQTGTHTNQKTNTGADTENKWGFLKNIVNIDTFFSSGAEKDGKENGKARKSSDEVDGSSADADSSSKSADSADSKEKVDSSKETEDEGETEEETVKKTSDSTTERIGNIDIIHDRPLKPIKEEAEEDVGASREEEFDKVDKDVKKEVRKSLKKQIKKMKEADSEADDDDKLTDEEKQIKANKKAAKASRKAMKREKEALKKQLKKKVDSSSQDDDEESTTEEIEKENEDLERILGKKSKFKKKVDDEDDGDEEQDEANKKVDKQARKALRKKRRSLKRELKKKQSGDDDGDDEDDEKSTPAEQQDDEDIESILGKNPEGKDNPSKPAAQETFKEKKANMMKKIKKKAKKQAEEEDDEEAESSDFSDKPTKEATSEEDKNEDEKTVLRPKNGKRGSRKRKNKKGTDMPDDDFEDKPQSKRVRENDDESDDEPIKKEKKSDKKEEKKAEPEKKEDAKNEKKDEKKPEEKKDEKKQDEKKDEKKEDKKEEKKVEEKKDDKKSETKSEKKDAKKIEIKKDEKKGEEKKDEKKVEEKKEEKKTEEKKEDKKQTSQSQYKPGFIAKYWYFKEGTDAKGYKTEGKEPDLIKITDQILFSNDASFRQEAENFPMDHFSGEWTGKIQIKKAGEYKFYTISDDGSRLWINGKQIVDNWGLHGNRKRYGKVQLSAGFHDFKATHFENAGGASMIVKWQGTDTDNKIKVLQGFHEEDKKDKPSEPTEAPKSEEPEYTKGFIASYWYFNKGTDQNGYNIEGIKPSLVKETEKINFANDKAFKEESPDFPDDHFFGEYRGKVKIQTAGKYVFSTASDDGSRLWVNEKKIVDNWGLHGTQERKGRIYLKAGYHDIRAVHFENAGGASMTVKYKGEDTKNKFQLLEGWHDANDKIQEEPSPKADLDEENYAEGFIAKYYFFDKDSTFDGYETKGVKPDLIKSVQTINFPNDGAFKGESKSFPNAHFQAEWFGKIEIKKEGKYRFFTTSDDGSRLWIDNKRIVNNWGLHGARERNGQILLEEGWHEFKSVFFQNSGGASMVVKWQGLDTDNKKMVLQGSHVGKVSDYVDQVEEPKKQPKYSEGFLGKYYFFNKGTNGNGYKIDNLSPSIVKPQKKIVFPNDNSFKEISSEFPADHFACQWTGKILIDKSGRYNFFTKSDDGSKLWINGKQLVNNMGLHGARQRSGRVTLDAGWHDFKAYHFENGGGANMIVTYKGPDTQNRKVELEGFHDKYEKVEDEKVEEKTEYQNGFLGEYYFFGNKGTNGNGYKIDDIKPSFVKPQETINFKNENQFRQIKTDFPQDHFACKWTGKIQIDQSGSYEFYTKSDDGSKLWINGKQLVDNMGLHGARQRSGRVTLDAGWHDFKAYHFENGGGANMIVTYKGPDTQNKKILLEGNHQKESKDDSEDEQKSNGFIGKFWYFKEGTNGDGYATKGIKPNLVKKMDKINFPNENRFMKLSKNFQHDHFASEWKGKIFITEGGKYTFSTASDDGSKLWINGKQIVDNMGLHGKQVRKGSIDLESGWHKFKAYHFENGGGSNMIAKYSGPDTQNKFVLVEGSHNGNVDEVDLPKGANYIQTEEDEIEYGTKALLK